ncbi:MFS transporter [Halobium salinum]|uniref:MFS transporter n=1 Tax=Halobium salinum TaxID=1364940 RepID=A0ABD5P927_9EURY|nr:MFS transporter [Halobium salinum]
MASLRSNGTFVRLLLGRVVTNAGDSLYSVAAMWLVYDLTGSALYTGVAGFLTFSTQVLQVFLGPLADRWSLRSVLLGTQAVQLVGVLLVPAAAATGHLSVWLVLGLMPLLALLNQFVYPAQHAALPSIVDDDQLVRANSLFSFAYQGVDMAFNAAAGALIVLVGAVTLYLVDAVTFALALVLFVEVVVPESEVEEDGAGDTADTADSADTTDSDDYGGDDADDGSYLGDLREGFGYVRGSLVLPMVLGSAVVNGAFGMAVAALPAFADTLGGPTAYGLLTAALGAGSLAGALGASYVEDLPYGRLQVAASVVSAGCITAAVLLPGLLPTVALFFAFFVPSGATGVVGSSMLQSAVDDAVLGRVMSVRNAASSAMMPVGALVGGWLATVVGPAAVVGSLGLASLFYASFFVLHPGLRTLPRVADADESVLGVTDGSRANTRPRTAATVGDN